MAHKISDRTVKAFDKFNADLTAFLKDSDNSPLYEDAFTTRQVSDFAISHSGTLHWIEDGRTETEKMFDEDEAKDYLKFWRACLRRAKRYWSMDTETLDKIQDGEMEDIEIED